ncbi:GspE/PulE family protein [Caldisericum exile]|uniref:Type 4 fimbrial assembly protein PilB n=1 Tax=Caldisericum exile (strain DSM 21853 / NBRC 104410 / AZM16c01) TaxID=511051 RepID=A0A7U6JGA2_CALEA|nr:GspE/PulE family protein [Caldisericum exile]BAL81439.1 putative type 4 fimbrial assembly protein PilB [Caldisericum exile AZM16c01]
MTGNLKLGEILLNEGKISKEQLESALLEQAKTGRKLGEILIERGLITPTELSKLLERQSSIPSISLEEIQPDPNISSVLPELFVRVNKVLPLRRINDALEVAVVPPINPEVLENVKLLTGLKVKPYIISDSEFDRALNKIYSIETKVDKVISTIGRKREEAQIRVISEVPTGAEPTTVNLANSIISDAIGRNASDIHIDPQQNIAKVRYRIDGIMYDILSIPKEIAESIVSLIKVNSGMDIAERRRPQDGHFSAKHEDEFYDFRVSSMGTSFGEKLNIRILSKQKLLMPLERLGMLKEQFDVFLNLIKRPYGIILVTGPTGSGKTTTLYSAISTLNTGEKEIITLEDPVEYNISGIVQIQINEEAGITFASGLRSILRLDPDIVMVGEIRDLETAKIAVEASLTGHLVFASIHTNDAASTPIRLLNLGVEPYLLASSLAGVIAQRLVRVICPNCKREYTADQSEKEVFLHELKVDVDKLFTGEGCPICGETGYKGRTGIFEIMEVNESIRELIEKSAPYNKIKEEAIRSNMISMRQAGLIKARAGITTLKEVERVAGL